LAEVKVRILRTRAPVRHAPDELAQPLHRLPLQVELDTRLKHAFALPDDKGNFKFRGPCFPLLAQLLP
jgi:hypothetical protein